MTASAPPSAHSLRGAGAPGAGGPPAHGLGVAAVLGAAVLWGTTGTASALAPAVSPLAIGAASMGFGGLLLAAVASRQIQAGWSALARSWRPVLSGGAAIAVYALAFYSSMRLAGVAIGTAVSIGAAPIIAALLERFLDHRPLSPRWGAGAALGIAGAVILCLAREGGEAGDGVSTVVGAGLGLVAAASYALYSWAGHRVMQRGVSSGAGMGAMFAVAAVPLLAILAATGAAFLDSWAHAAVGAYLAVVPMFAGYVLFAHGLGRVGASTATTVSLAEPVVAAVLAVAVVGEVLTLPAWGGMGLIVAGLAVLTVPVGAVARRAPARGDG
ncbi:DMT family transporter [Sinomonas halotolerans]|uniref:DMT family transporter n=1 Tax=Sinomonas halotolerans TaxID=1644133 RepID=A0ABU9X0Z2_9MICC